MLLDLKELALEVSTDPDHKFDLAIQLDDLESALILAREAPVIGSQSKWRTVGDRALASWKVTLAEECFLMANDLGALLLIYTSTGNREGLKKLSELAGEFDLFLTSCSAIWILIYHNLVNSNKWINKYSFRRFFTIRINRILCRPPPPNR